MDGVSANGGRLERAIATLEASFQSEIRRIDQVNSLQKESVSVALVAAEKAVTAALAAADKATDKAEISTRESFTKVNEFRGALDDLTRMMATRRELDDFKLLWATKSEEMSKQIVSLGSRLDTSPDVRELARRADMNTGGALSMHRAIPYVFTFAGLVLTILFFYLALRK